MKHPTLYLEHRLWPHSRQTAQLQRQFDLAERAWQILRARAALESAGTLSEVEIGQKLSQPVGPVLDARRRVPVRGRTDRREWLRGWARLHGWTSDVDTAVLDGVASSFGRTLRGLGPSAPITRIPVHRPSLPLCLGSRVRPVADYAVELPSVDDLVLVSGYLWPVAADLAIETWRSNHLVRLVTAQRELEERVLQGDAGAVQGLASHHARHTGGLPRRRTALELGFDGFDTGGVQLEFAERAELRRAPGPGGPLFYLRWEFRVLEVPLPCRPGVAAIDPGQVNLLTVATPGTVRQIANPVPWAARASVLPPGQPGVRRSADWVYAQLRHDALLFRRRLRPAFEAGILHALGHQHLVIEDTDYAGFRAQGSSYADWAEASGSRLYLAYAAGLAEARGTPARLITPRGTSATCAACGRAAAMHYQHREARCRFCHHRVDRDVNAAQVMLRWARERGG